MVRSDTRDHILYCGLRMKACKRTLRVIELIDFAHSRAWNWTLLAVRLQLDEPVSTAPTIGFNVETLQYKNIKFQVCHLRHWQVEIVLAWET